MRTLPATAGESIDVKLRKPDFVIIAALAGIVVFVLAGRVNEISRLPQTIDQRSALNRDVISSIAVLPFENLSADASDDCLAAGVQDALITALGSASTRLSRARSRVIEINPSLVRAHYRLAWLAEQYRDAEMFDKAIEYHEKLRDNYFWSCALAATLGKAGRIVEARELARRIEDRGTASLVMVLIHASMNDYDTAYTWLLKAGDDKIPWYPRLLKWYPQTEGFQGNPRVVELAAEQGI